MPPRYTSSADTHAMVARIAPGILELLERELLRLALDLLHREHIDRLTHREVDDAVDPGANGIDVPGGKAHGDKPRVGRALGPL